MRTDKFLRLIHRVHHATAGFDVKHHGAGRAALTAHIGKDTYSHIHYDSAQGRVITVREAARLQSFPDGFTFAGEAVARLAPPAG